MDRIILPIIFVGTSFLIAYGNKIKEIFSTFKFKDEDINIIYKYFELNYQMKNKIIKLSKVLINNNKDFLKKIVEKIKALHKDEDLQKILSEKKKIILLGHTGVGKSTLINCIEKKKISQEAIIEAPTTMEFKGYNSSIYNNFVFYDTRGIENKKISEIEDYNIEKISEILKGQNSYLFWFE